MDEDFEHVPEIVYAVPRLFTASRITVFAQDTMFRVPASILCKSFVLAHFLDFNLKFKEQRTLNLPSIQPHVFRILLSFLQGNELKFTDPTLAAEFCAQSSYLGLEPCVQQSLNYLSMHSSLNFHKMVCVKLPLLIIKRLLEQMPASCLIMYPSSISINAWRLLLCKTASTYHAFANCWNLTFESISRFLLPISKNIKNEYCQLKKQDMEIMEIKHVFVHICYTNFTGTPIFKKKQKIIIPDNLRVCNLPPLKNNFKSECNIERKRVIWVINDCCNFGILNTWPVVELSLVSIKIDVQTAQKIVDWIKCNPLVTSLNINKSLCALELATILFGVQNSIRNLNLKNNLKESDCKNLSRAVCELPFQSFMFGDNAMTPSLALYLMEGLHKSRNIIKTLDLSNLMLFQLDIFSRAEWPLLLNLNLRGNRFLPATVASIIAALAQNAKNLKFLDISLLTFGTIVLSSLATHLCFLKHLKTLFMDSIQQNIHCGKMYLVLFESIQNSSLDTLSIHGHKFKTMNLESILNSRQFDLLMDFLPKHLKKTVRNSKYSVAIWTPLEIYTNRDSIRNIRKNPFVSEISGLCL